MEKAKSGNSLQKAAAAAAILVVLGMLAWRYNMPLSELEERAYEIGILKVWLIFIFSFVAINVLPIPGRDLFKLAGATLFGYGSIAAMWAGEMLAAVVSFWVARLGGYDLVRWLFGKRLLAMNDRLQKATWRSIFIIRIIPVTPYRIFNFAAGVVNLSFTAYFWGSLWGTLIRAGIIQLLIVPFDDALKTRGTTVWEVYLVSLILVPVMFSGLWLMQRRGRRRAGTLGQMPPEANGDEKQRPLPQ